MHNATDIKSNTFSQTTLAVALVISVAINFALIVLHFSQKELRASKDALLVGEVAEWKEKARAEFAKAFLLKHTIDGQVLIPKGTRVSCNAGQCDKLTIELPENY